MMYHFMFGLRGGSLVTATPSALGGCSPPAAASFFSSSCMIKLSSSLLFDLVAPEIAVQKRNASLNQVVDHPKVDAENKYCDHNNCGGSAHFLPRRRGNLAHLGAHVVVKRLDPLRPRLEPLSKTSSDGRD